MNMSLMKRLLISLIKMFDDDQVTAAATACFRFRSLAVGSPHSILQVWPAAAPVARGANGFGENIIKSTRQPVYKVYRVSNH